MADDFYTSAASQRLKMIEAERAAHLADLQPTGLTVTSKVLARVVQRCQR